MSDNSSLFLPPDIKTCKKKKKHCHVSSSSHSASSSDISKLIDIIECMNNKINKLEKESDVMRVKIRALCKRVEKLENQDNCSSSHHHNPCHNNPDPCNNNPDPCHHNNHHNNHHDHHHDDHHDNACNIEHRLRKLETDTENLFIIAFDKKI